MTGYKVITANNTKDLEWLLEDLILQNWEPHGSLSVYKDAKGSIKFSQAMVLL